MQFSISGRILLGLGLALVASLSFAQTAPYEHLVTDVEAEFAKLNLGGSILDAAKNFFWFLATVSLVWTMGLQIVRQDIGEALMELLRFVVATGTLYWLLVNASTQGGGEGFVQLIVDSFYQMTNNDDSGSAFRTWGNSGAWRAVHVYLKVVEDTAVGEDPDRIVGGIMGVLILVVLTLLAAQFLLALIMAWLLGYGGIFLLGFGGSRWTSQIAINYYKHVVALGIAIISLGAIGIASDNVFANVIPSFGLRSQLTYLNLAMTLAVSLLMLVLGIRVPQLLYTLVTGSSIGLFAGTAGMVGSAIATGGGAAFASAHGGFSTGPGTGDMSGSNGSRARSPSAMEAVERSAASAGAMADSFHVAGGADPFGVTRGTHDQRVSHGSVFGATADARVMPDITRPGDGASDSSPAALAEGKAGRVAASGVVSAAAISHDRSFSPPRADEELARPDYLAEMSALTSARGKQPTTAATEPWQDSDPQAAHQVGDLVSVVNDVRPVGHRGGNIGMQSDAQERIATLSTEAEVDTGDPAEASRQAPGLATTTASREAIAQAGLDVPGSFMDTAAHDPLLAEHSDSAVQLRANISEATVLQSTVLQSAGPDAPESIVGPSDGAVGAPDEPFVARYAGIADESAPTEWGGEPTLVPTRAPSTDAEGAT